MTPEQLDDYERLVSMTPFNPVRTIIRALRASWADTEAAQTRATQAEKLMAQTVERLMRSEELTDTLHKERDEARAEAGQLRERVRQVHGLVSRVRIRSTALMEDIETLREIHKLTKDEP